MPATDPVQAVAEALIDHTRLRPPSGECSCGHEVPLGHSFAMHQAEAAVAAARPAICDALADLAQRQEKAIRELSSELVEVAQRSPQALTLLQLEAVVNERDALAARLAAVEALAEGPTGEGDLTKAQKDALRLLLATGVLTVTRRISSSVPSPGFGDLMMQGDDQGRVRYYLKGAYGDSADVTDEVARYIEEHGTRGVAISADYQQAIDRELT